ncbi:hypothetical protein [Kitasatospora sp. NPDC090091]|uniref:hypothetical protein n=1 Tax=Kitasatospora sp. NPDC090091 TaxID=3364081 RepID=UPI003830170E
MASTRRPTADRPNAGWQQVNLQWRRPRLLELMRVLTSIPIAVLLAERGGEDPVMIGATATLALHTAADVGARCVRRTRS